MIGWQVYCQGFFVDHVFAAVVMLSWQLACSRVFCSLFHIILSSGIKIIGCRDSHFGYIHYTAALLLSDLYSQERVASHFLDALTIRSIGRGDSLITITKRLKVQFKRYDRSKVEERTEQHNVLEWNCTLFGWIEKKSKHDSKSSFYTVRILVIDMPR